MAKCFLAFACILAISMSVAAQTKLVATIDCQKADLQHTIAIPDQQGFEYQISQNKCTWRKGSALEGIESKDAVNVIFDDVRGAAIRTTHTQVTHYTNGDKVFVTGTGNLNQKTSANSGKWSYTGGTGKFRGIKGSGTYTCKSTDANGNYSCDVEGEYTLPAAKK
jgi:hypothetical protein